MTIDRTFQCASVNGNLVTLTNAAGGMKVDTGGLVNLQEGKTYEIKASIGLFGGWGDFSIKEVKDA